MNSVIGENQMAFVRGRQIMDSFVVAEEIIHSWRKDKEGGLLVKLDFEKAYDSVDHSFLDFILEEMGFGARWHHWVNSCISTSSLSVLVNGSPSSEFSEERGLRQGDLLSPFLFNIVVECLSCCLSKAFELNMVRGAFVGKDKMHVSHLQFADDTVLFLEPKIEFLVNMRRILRCFEMASGLRINFHKSCVVNVGKKRQGEEFWAVVLKCKAASLLILYLGMPLGARSSTKVFWKSVVERIEKCLAPWKRKFLSKGGRLVLIKSVLSTIPIYYMSMFKVPSNAALVIEKCQRSFFWGDGVEKIKLHAIDWGTIVKGMGGWELYGADFRGISWLRNGGPSDSPFVKAVTGLFKEGSLSKRILEGGLKLVVGNGVRISFWSDIWCDTVTLQEKFPRVFALAIKKHGFISEFGSWVAWWFKHHGKGSPEPITTILENLKTYSAEVKLARPSVSMKWRPLQAVNLSFNVDGSVMGLSGKAGIGGVLRNSLGDVVCFFSAPVDEMEVSTVELMAIHKVCAMCASRSDFVGKNISIRSDSRSAVSWVNDKDFGNLRLWELIVDIRSLLFFFFSR
ncbi:hypothetical protein LWI29_026061 [Acer saccharum]|uniref:Reverse transcriptase domain-containing protein n=1 Tax=Acer saccharum TaxID=4024 RepID=A0AA39T3G2_ACESA|nr:hypothetical protein LWI29_026061 [Acer saccharum]